jgi:hypothetical protein
MGLSGRFEYFQTFIIIRIVVLVGCVEILVAFLQIYIRILLTSNIVGV